MKGVAAELDIHEPSVDVALIFDKHDCSEFRFIPAVPTDNLQALGGFLTTQPDILSACAIPLRCGEATADELTDRIKAGQPIVELDAAYGLITFDLVKQVCHIWKAL